MIALAKDPLVDAVTGNHIEEIVEEMHIDGWSHSDTVQGCWDTRTMHLQPLARRQNHDRQP